MIEIEECYYCPAQDFCLLFSHHLFKPDCDEELLDLVYPCFLLQQVTLALVQKLDKAVTLLLIAYDSKQVYSIMLSVSYGFWKKV